MVETLRFRVNRHKATSGILETKVGVLYYFAVHGSNLRWQVTKIIRHLQADLAALVIEVVFY